MARAIGVTELLAKKYKTLPFVGDWKRCMGLPAVNFKMIAVGDSGNGKTSFITMFCKMLAGLDQGKVLYNSIEEGDSASIQDSWRSMGMADVAGNILLLDKEPVPSLINRIKKSRSIKFVVLDSIQMARMNEEQYDQLKKAAGKRVALIFISHAEGKLPKGSLAKDIRYDADIKVYIEGFVAQITSRYGTKGGLVIWKQGAEDYWGATLSHIVSGLSLRQAAQAKKKQATNQIPMDI